MSVIQSHGLPGLRLLEETGIRDAVTPTVCFSSADIVLSTLPVYSHLPSIYSPLR